MKDKIFIGLLLLIGVVSSGVIITQGTQIEAGRYRVQMMAANGAVVREWVNVKAYPARGYFKICLSDGWREQDCWRVSGNVLVTPM